MATDTAEERHAQEINYWRDSPDESPQSNSVHNILNKMGDASVFLACISRMAVEGKKDARVLELGAGQGWASCLFKRLYPDSNVTVTDISPHAIASLHRWEQLWGAKVDRAYACRSYETREDSASIDIAFTFAAAHHFVRHRRTLAELARILRPGGKAFYLYEPTSSELLYRAARWRVNRIRPAVPEDVLRTSKLRAMGADCGLSIHVDYFPSLLRRGPIETLYYALLARAPALQRLLPCTANIVISKP
jgi:SAM-dependent methyltransferase